MTVEDLYQDTTHSGGLTSIDDAYAYNSDLYEDEMNGDGVEGMEEFALSEDDSSAEAETLEIVMDTRSPEASSTGGWFMPQESDSQEGESLWSCDGATYSWTFSPRISGDYNLSMWWTEWVSGNPAVPVEIEDSSGTTTVYINQQQNGGQWNNLGLYHFESGNNYQITILAQGAAGTCAKAVKIAFVP